MKTTVKYPSETTAHLTISLDPSEIENAKSVALAKLARELKVPGFRKGKVPISVASKHVNPNTLQEETLENAVSKAVAEAFMSKNIQALERPAVEVKKFVPNTELEFTAEVQIVPAVKLGDYKKLKAKATKATVSAKDVDELIERMRQNFVEKKNVTRAAKIGDEVTMDFTGTKDGEPFEGGAAEAYSLKLGEGQFIPGFEEAIVGHKPGDTFDVKLSFPKDYHVKDLAGQPVVFSVVLHGIQELALPDVNDEFAAKCGPFTDMEGLKADIKKELMSQKEKEASEKLKDELVKELSESSKVALPELLIEDQMRSIEQDLMQNLAYRGLELESYLTTQKFADKDDWLKKEVRPAAEKRVKAGLVLAELSKQLKIDVSRDEVDQTIGQLKQQYSNDPAMAARFNDPNVHRDIANRLVTDKTVEQLLTLNA